MKEDYSAKDLAGLPGMPGTERSINRKAHVEQWPFREVPAPGGPGGKRREYHISSLPAATKLHLYSLYHTSNNPTPITNTPKESTEGLALPAAITRSSRALADPGSLPEKRKPGKATQYRATANTSTDRTVCLPAQGNPGSALRNITTASLSIAPRPSPPRVPEKARTIALARLDLLRLWQEYRSTHTKATDADREFESAYNAGVLFPALFGILGKVSRQTLYRWKAFVADTMDWAALIPQYYIRDSLALRLTREEEQAFLSLLLHPNRYKIGHSIRLLRYAFSSRGMTLDKSDMTLRRYAEEYKSRHYDRWILMREGQKALRDKVNFYIKRDPSLLEVGEVLVADGHRLNFQVINPYTGKPCRATLVGYLDWKSYDLAGYEIMIEESTQCIAAALRNGILRLGKYPTIAYQDNGKAFRSRFFTDRTNLEDAGFYGLFGRLGIVPVFAQPYNARAKIIERWFKEFSDTFERLMPSFVGSSIEDKPARLKRNEPFHKSMSGGMIPTISQTIQLISAWHDFHRSQPCPHVKGKTIGQVFDEGCGPGVDANDLDDLMMAMKKTRIDRNGIRFLNADYYDDALYGLREEIVIRYSLFDLSAIKVYTLSGEPICIAKRFEAIHPMAAHLGDARDMEDLKQKLSEQHRNEKKTIEGAKKLLAVNPRIEMAWEGAIAATPGLVERFEKADIPLPATERHIPIEAVKPPESVDTPVIEPTGQNEIPDPKICDFQEAAIEKAVANRPFFRENYERYEWHLKYGTHSDEDEAWIAWYKTTKEYKMLYEFFEKQAQATKGPVAKPGQSATGPATNL
ncbi:MAG TPA: Mu transposase C-terminal domain-containing protein [Syntrophorhabdaceae bacterium]|nr:Mu transposase C-terminal domain-containing protein [Syntrophorhabdaceae bacterium]HQM82858.1 Mu transposase C-terminal domain-containing protein [Syntrophorhabdaceae bacterium]